LSSGSSCCFQLFPGFSLVLDPRGRLGWSGRPEREGWGAGEEFEDSDNNNNQDNVYGTVIMAEPLREFTQFI